MAKYKSESYVDRSFNKLKMLIQNINAFLIKAIQQA